MLFSTIRSLKELSVKDPICLNCLSDDFDDYVSFGGQILFCGNCYAWSNPELGLDTLGDHAENNVIDIHRHHEEQHP